MIVRQAARDDFLTIDETIIFWGVAPIYAGTPVGVVEMQVAYSYDGKPIEATQYAPAEARCPSCGGVVILRRRRLMAGRGAVHYWLHRANESRRCPARFSPVGK